MGEPVRCYLITKDARPVGTLWALDWPDAFLGATALYGDNTDAIPSCQEPNLWLDAYDREAKATHAENEAMIAFAASRVVDRTMTVLEKLFPFLLQDE